MNWVRVWNNLYPEALLKTDQPANSEWKLRVGSNINRGGKLHREIGKDNERSPAKSTVFSRGLCLVTWSRLCPLRSNIRSLTGWGRREQTSLKNKHANSKYNKPGGRGERKLVF